jgi:toxin FitB
MPILILDSHPLSLISNPANRPESLNCKSRIQQLVAREVLVAVPEIIDYELRRALICGKKTEGIKNLDKLGEMGIVYIPITSDAMRKAAELWAWARNTGQQTASNDKIDIDVILAAQSIIISQDTGEHTVIATSNVSDLERYTYAKKWEEITVEYFAKLCKTKALTLSKTE